MRPLAAAVLLLLLCAGAAGRISAVIAWDRENSRHRPFVHLFF